MQGNYEGVRGPINFLIQAFQELAKGEQTATALENQLNAMEAKIEALLAQAEKEQQERQNLQQANAKPNGHESSRQE